VKVCLAASAGGHLTQLYRVVPACFGHDYFIVTTKEGAQDPSRSSARVYYVGWANRNHPYLLLKVFLRCLRLILSERPDVLISTGAAVGCVLAIQMKALGKRVIWVDTISHTEYLTLSGRIVRYFSDEFLVQWPDLVEKYPGTKYVGSIL
jgi:UDP-N-acetylglucosamine:LPS N-acetylglucosamine transferase